MDEPTPDFESAAIFLQQMREAWEGGDRRAAESARYLLAVAIGIHNGPRVNSYHLKSEAR